jgi:phenylalanyl-tRNA synthetase beta chain
MRVPLSSLRELCPGIPDGEPLAVARQVATVLARLGLEEEGLHRADLTGPVVVGEVLSAEPEPQKNGKTINWCQVRVGADDVRGIVCGAGNFGPGDRVVVALPGAVLPGGFEISARRTYGHVSDGMICSERELEMGEDHSGILVLGRLGIAADDPGARPGDDAIALLGLDDVTLEVNVTPDRGYWLSLRGVAREYALATGIAYGDPAPDLTGRPTPPVGHDVRIADDAPLRGLPGCDRYVARSVTGFDPAAVTPLWIRRVLQKCGMRPISLAVDVTNYVMLLTGQPLHAFDRETLAETIVVRRARAGERLLTLDDVDRELHPEDLLITDEAPDGACRVLALAGVMGGSSSEVTAGTTSLLLEAAHFDPITVARTARRHKLGTEAGRRFERGVDHNLADRAAALAVRLLVEHGGGRPGGVTDVDQRVAVEQVTMGADLPQRLIGVPIAHESVKEALVSVGCQVDEPGTGDVDGSGPGGRVDEWTVRVPSWRPDLRRAADLVEEVARVYGYDKIPSVLPPAPGGRGLTRAQRLRRSAARALAEGGLVEVLTYPFVAPERSDELGLPEEDPRRRALRLANPLSEQRPLLRTSLLATLPDAARRNLARGVRDLAIFEVGRVFRPGGEPGTAPRPPGGTRPPTAVLAELDAGVPAQPLRAAVLLAGRREQAGWWGPGRVADWSDAVDVVQRLAGSLGVGPLVVSADRHAPWHPGRCARLSLADSTLVGHAGELAPAVALALELPERACAAEIDLDVLVAAAPELVAAEPVSTQPVALRDVAVVVGADVPAGAVETALREGGGALVEDVRLFDDYCGEQVPAGTRSLAYRLVLRAPDRTLTGDEAQAVVAAALRSAADRTAAVLRSES